MCLQRRSEKTLRLQTWILSGGPGSQQRGGRLDLGKKTPLRETLIVTGLLRNPDSFIRLPFGPQKFSCQRQRARNSLIQTSGPTRSDATRREPAACYRLLPLEAALSDHRALSQLQLSGRRHEPLELNTDVSQATNQRRPLCVEATADDPTLTPSGRKMQHTYPGLGRKSINIVAMYFICMEKFGNKIYLR